MVSEDKMTLAGFVINLDRDTDRYQAFLKKFQPNLIKIDRFSAVDGKVYRSGKPDDLSFFAQYFATNKAIGCFKSHLLIWQQIVDQNLPFAVIFEDDVFPVDPEQWEHQIQSVITKMNDSAPWDVILLGYHSQFMTNYSDQNVVLFEFMKLMNFAKKSRRIDDDLVIPVTFAGTHSYVVSQAGARKLLKECSLIAKSPVDIRIAALHVQNKINIVACVRPVIVTYGASENHYFEWLMCEGISTIGNFEIKTYHFLMLIIALLLLFFVTRRSYFLYLTFFVVICLLLLIYPEC